MVPDAQSHERRTQRKPISKNSSLSFFEPIALVARVKELGFTQVWDLGPDDANARYFAGRTDGLCDGGLSHACGDPEFGSSGSTNSVVSPKLARSESAHRRVDAGDEPGVERAALGGRKAFPKLRAILDSEDYGGHARDGERVAMGECGR